MQVRSASEPFRNNTYGDIQGVDVNISGPDSQPVLYTPGREVTHLRFRHLQTPSLPGRPITLQMHQTNLPVVREDGDDTIHLPRKSFETGEESAHPSMYSSPTIQPGPGQRHNFPSGSGANITTPNTSRRVPPSYRTQLSEEGSLRRPRYGSHM